MDFREYSPSSTWNFQQHSPQEPNLEFSRQFLQTPLNNSRRKFQRENSHLMQELLELLQEFQVVPDMIPKRLLEHGEQSPAQGGAWKIPLEFLQNLTEFTGKQGIFWELSKKISQELSQKSLRNYPKKSPRNSFKTCHRSLENGENPGIIPKHPTGIPSNIPQEFLQKFQRNYPKKSHRNYPKTCHRSLENGENSGNYPKKSPRNFIPKNPPGIIPKNPPAHWKMGKNLGIIPKKSCRNYPKKSHWNSSKNSKKSCRNSYKNSTGIIPKNPAGISSKPLTARWKMGSEEEIL